MRYISIYTHKPRSTPPSADEIATMTKLVEEGQREGWLVVTEGVAFGQVGVRVHADQGKVTVTDGPFAEAKEVIGGYWMIQVKSREEAIEWATRCPASENEVIEIRQVHEFSEFPPDVQRAAAGFSEMQAGPGGAS